MASKAIQLVEDGLLRGYNLHLKKGIGKYFDQVSHVLKWQCYSSNCNHESHEPAVYYDVYKVKDGYKLYELVKWSTDLNSRYYLVLGPVDYAVISWFKDAPYGTYCYLRHEGKLDDLASTNPELHSQLEELLQTN
jgi:hypothetical protein